ncbi:MAG: HU family DNA-binding protein, partial [Desulfobacteraceae bacterium]|nr:HU family DNA-binding protein [Desulfobacteraceae bacterium]
MNKTELIENVMGRTKLQKKEVSQVVDGLFK